jgi:putative phosphoesterase
MVRGVRVLLLSDTHGVLDPRVRALATTADRVVHAGDVGSSEVLDRLGNVRAVLGNNDVPGKWQGDPAVQANLPQQFVEELPGGLLVAEHGHKALPASRRHEVLRARHPEARLIVYGHSHRLIVDDAESPWVVNPGAAGLSRTFGGPSAILLKATKRSWTLDVHRFPLEHPRPPYPTG